MNDPLVVRQFDNLPPLIGWQCSAQKGSNGMEETNLRTATAIQHNSLRTNFIYCRAIPFSPTKREGFHLDLLLDHTRSYDPWLARHISGHPDSGETCHSTGASGEVNDAALTTTRTASAGR